MSENMENMENMMEPTMETTTPEIGEDGAQALIAGGVSLTAGAVAGYKIGYKNGIKDTVLVANSYLPADKQLDAGVISAQIKATKKKSKKHWWNDIEFHKPVTFGKKSGEGIEKPKANE